jgi:cytochrome c
MSDLTFNKIAGGVLAAGLAVFLLKEVTAEMFTTEPPEKPGYAITVQEETTGGAAAAVDVPPDWGTVLPAANPEAGKAITAKCASCHTFDPGGANGTGPNLNDVLGRKPASHPGFSYSAAMTDFGSKNPAWDFDHVYMFLANPGKYISGTKMTFVGLKSPEDRIAVVAYLHSLNPKLPIPAPKPAAAAPAPGGEAAAPAAAGASAPAPATPSAVVPDKGSQPG